MNYCRFCILLHFLSFQTFSQQDSIPPKQKTGNCFSFNYENDFFSATDRYYTQGVWLTLTHPAVRRSPVSFLLPKNKKADLNYYSLHIEQDVFTPRSIRYMGGSVYYGERPFTAVFFLSHILRSVKSGVRTALTTQLDLGILGPDALGEEEQKAIHKALVNIEPQGWQNQLCAAPIINYRAKFEKGFVSTRYFEFIGSASARCGTLYTDAAFGMILRVGRLVDYFKSFAGTAVSKRAGISIYVKPNLRAVGYNATLQGGINSKNIYQLSAHDVTRMVADVSGGLVFSFRRIILEYSRTYITAEFKNGVDHGWGKCSISCLF